MAPREAKEVSVWECFPAVYTILQAAVSWGSQEQDRPFT